MAVLTAALFFGRNVAIAQTSPSPADFTTQGLYALCKSPNSVDNLRCGEYLGGVSDIMSLSGTGSELPDYSAAQRSALKVLGLCFPASEANGVTVGVLVQVFINWAEKHPTQWNIHRSFGAAAAFQEAWPCK
jgi:hypothetical protein